MKARNQRIFGGLRTPGRRDEMRQFVVPLSVVPVSRSIFIFYHPKETTTT